MGNKRLKLCPCSEEREPIGLGFKKVKQKNLNKKPTLKFLKTSDFVPSAFFVFTDNVYVTYSWAFKICQESLCHITLRSYMGK